LQSVMSHNFGNTPGPVIERSTFDRSHGLKSTFDAGYLVPVFVDEALPGDTFNLSMTAFARLATPLKPIMDNIFLDSFFFAVPYRLIWDNWKKFNGEQVNPADSTDFLIPTVTGTNVLTGTMWDYFGLPTNVTGPLTVSALPFRAANLCYNEWFRDQNLIDSLPVPTNDGPDALTNYNLFRRGKRPDYFTSALPWPSKGPDTILPIGTQIDLSSKGVPPTFTGGGYTDVTIGTQQGSTNVVFGGVAAGSAASVIFGTETGLKVDLMAGDMATVRSLREAFQLARLFERDARSGTRYVEIVKAHFGVSMSSERWRPEYLGGGTSMVNIHPVAQTSGSADAGGYTDTPQGNLSAFGTASMSGHGFSKTFEEHSIVLGFVSVRADLTYQQGIDRMWLRSTRYDFYWPALSHLSEQEVWSKEIFADGTANDDIVFGYQERGAEYRFKRSQITGLFRSNAAGTLHAWHLAQEFTAAPELDNSFIVEDPPLDRCIAVTTQPHFILDAYFRYHCARPMPLYGVPGLRRF